MCYGYAIKAFISNMYDDNILVGGGVFQRPVLYGDFPIQSICTQAPNPKTHFERGVNFPTEIKIYPTENLPHDGEIYPRRNAIISMGAS